MNGGTAYHPSQHSEDGDRTTQTLCQHETELHVLLTLVRKLQF